MMMRILSRSGAAAKMGNTGFGISSGLTSTLFVLVFVAGTAQLPATESIIVEYARGRNKVAIQLWQNAEEHLEKGDVAAAHRDVDASIRSDPTLYPALYTRAKIEIKENKWLPALQDCSNALHQDPTFVEAALLRAEINSHLGKYAESIKEVDHVVSIRPRLDGLARALSQRAWFRLSCPDPSFRDPKQALKDAMTACKILQWRDEDMIDTLAVACAQTGDFDAAVRYETEALQTEGITADETKMYQGHLASFKAHRTLPTR
jgi:tetratricopeptide (TPR) repeat protein